MSSIQYTIRSIPPRLDKALREQSKATGKSLNEIVITTLEKGSGTNSSDAFDDLNWFIGNKSLSESFDKDQAWLDDLPKDI